MHSPAVFQVVGYSNSGKTTLVRKWLEQLSSKGWKTATIKHHGHGRKLTVNDEGKDSNVHRQAGALGTLVTSDNELQWNLQLEQPMDLETLVDMYKVFPLDLIIVEGYKLEPYPKLVIIRGEEDLPLIQTCRSITMVVCWQDEQKEKLLEELDIPVFHIDEERDYLDWLNKWLSSQKGEQ